MNVIPSLIIVRYCTHLMHAAKMNYDLQQHQHLLCHSLYTMHRRIAKCSVCGVELKHAGSTTFNY